MKKLLLIQTALILIMNSSSAMAEWDLIGTVGDDRVYIDKSTIRKKGNLVKMWSMISYFHPKQYLDKDYASTKFYDEYDCSDYSMRPISLVSYSRGDGKGDVINSYTNNSGQFEPLVPSGVNESLWKKACGKQ